MIHNFESKLYLRILSSFFLIFNIFSASSAEPENNQLNNNYNMWLNYQPLQKGKWLSYYDALLSNVIIKPSSETGSKIKEELNKGLGIMLGKKIEFNEEIKEGSLILLTPKDLRYRKYVSKKITSELGEEEKEGYFIINKEIEGNNTTLIIANKEIGLFYGTFHLLRLIQTHKGINNLNIKEFPKTEFRIANHWDNIDRTVERGYAGLSLWDWKALPNKKSKRYKDYARFCASVGINSIVINNVNANAHFISREYLQKISALANVFRPYGVKVFIAINFNSPQIIGNLDTADPLNEEVRKWWGKKVNEIHSYIPDMGGFLVKADSEGQPGPNTYGRTHADGANMLAKALKSFEGVVIWRAFVYGERQKDRIREAYDEFKPLDGEFDENVILQVKKGPLDFMPREPFSPLFGSMKQTNTMVEFQITQEYLGNEFHLLYKGGMYDKILKSDTYAEGKQTYVGDIVSGKVYDYKYTGMAGVINPGIVENWTAHPFVQSSWYAFGRLAWDYNQDPWEIAKDWIGMTFSNEKNVKKKILKIMKLSEEAGVNYREPLGLTHIGAASHYGPAPWSGRSKRFHRVSKTGIGFDRSANGSNAVSQYYEPLASKFNNFNSVPEDLLLWFHHVPWDFKMKSGKSLWEELVESYYLGVEQVREIQKLWNSLSEKIDKETFKKVQGLLEIQLRDAIVWRNSCILYFQTFSKKEISKKFEKPEKDLEYYKKLR